MPFSDFMYVFQWWALFAVIGILFLPATMLLFPTFIDKGYLFGKVLGIIILSYLVLILGMLHIFPFSRLSTLFILIVSSITIAIYVYKKRRIAKEEVLKKIHVFLLEEALFFACLLFWSNIRGNQPDIHGLEKFMDFGFINSILRSDFFPPKDMWLTSLPINYYYFGHLVTAVLTKLSGIASSVTYNLMVATIFSLTFAYSFSIGLNLFHHISNKLDAQRLSLYPIIAGIVTAFLVSLSGNLHTMYAFFKPYAVENPVPFWQLTFLPQTFPNSYWYPNATRFIYNTIHEFPLYSFVVSDLHGHVLSIPIVLFIVALLFSLLLLREEKSSKANSAGHSLTLSQIVRTWRLIPSIQTLLLLSFLLAVAYMTNAWDGMIYFLLTACILLFIKIRPIFIKREGSLIRHILLIAPSLLFLLLGLFLFSLPFSLFFKPFVSGVGVLCAPAFLTDIGALGPFLFEANHCQKSPLWQLFILYGFFYFFVFTFLAIFIVKRHDRRHILNTSNILILILIIVATILILTPEFIYIKDIYPAHYRANTMFKLVYQAFIMLSLVSGYVITRMFVHLKNSPNLWTINFSNWRLVASTVAITGFFFVLLYPLFAISSYYGNLNTYKGLDGLTYLKDLYPTDYDAILWINTHVQGQPVIAEAQGDSYTDYARVSANTGLPTILGWLVHEWLWRGSYSIPSPRITEVQTLYEAKDKKATQNLLKKYNVSLVFIGDLERQKYPNIDEGKFAELGKLIYQNGTTRIYKVE